MITVAWYFNDFPFGGAEKVTLDIARSLTRYCTDITPVIIARRFMHPVDGIKCISLPADTSMLTPAGKQELIDALKSNGIDVYIQAMDPPRGLLAEIRKQMPRLAIINHYHSMPFWHVTQKCFNRPLSHLREKLFRSYTRRYLRRYRDSYAAADCWVTLCDAYTATFRKILGPKVYTMHNPIDTEAFADCAKVSKKKEVLYLGRLSRDDKRVDRVLKAWHKVWSDHPDWKLKIVGSGPDEIPLKRMARSLRLENVEFCGYSDNPAEHYSTASILCLTSEYEGWGMVLIEALASNVRVLAMTCSDGVREIIEQSGSTGVPAGNNAKFAEELNRLMSSHINVANCTARNYFNRFSLQATAAQWSELLHSITSKHQSEK